MGRTFDTADSRTLKAYRLAMTQASWVRCRSKLTNRPLAFGIESASRPGLFHMVTLQTCSCPGFKYGGDCYHVRAVALVVQQRKAMQTTNRAA
jgi:hypothetical protein